jgi:hypothetical protein
MTVCGTAGGLCVTGYVLIVSVTQSFWPSDGVWEFVPIVVVSVACWFAFAYGLADSIDTQRKRRNRRLNRANPEQRMKRLIDENPGFLPGILNYESREAQLAAFLLEKPKEPFFRHNLRADEMADGRYVVTSATGTTILGYIAPQGGEFLVDHRVHGFLGNYGSLDDALQMIGAATR